MIFQENDCFVIILSGYILAFVVNIVVNFGYYVREFFYRFWELGRVVFIFYYTGRRCQFFIVLFFRLLSKGLWFGFQGRSFWNQRQQVKENRFYGFVLLGVVIVQQLCLVFGVKERQFRCWGLRGQWSKQTFQGFGVGIIVFFSLCESGYYFW